MAWAGETLLCGVRCCCSRLEGKLQGETSPLPLSCLYVSFLMFESLCCPQISEPVPLGGREADGAPDGRDVCRHVLAGFISRIPSWREGWREVSSSSTVTQCHSVTRSHQAGKSRITFVSLRGSRSSSPLGCIRAEPGCHAPPHNLLEQEMLPQSLS